MTTKNILNSLIMMSDKKLNYGIRAVLVMLFFTLGVGNAWAGGTSTVNVYATANVQPSTTGRGKVYVGKSTTNSPSYQDGEVSVTNSTSSTSRYYGLSVDSKNISFYCYAQVTAHGYYFKGWSETNSESATALSSTSPYTCSISTNNTSSPGTTKTLYALFVPIAISNPSPITYNSTSLTETKTWTIDFTHTGGDRQEDFRNATISSTSGDGQWTVTNTQYVNTTTVRVTCTYTANRDQYSNSAGTRIDEAMLSLSSAGGESTGSTTISVQFPEVTISDATGGAALIKDNASDVKSGSVVFPVSFAESINNFATPTITKTSGEGTWAITDYVYADNKVTINYSHTGGGTYGTRASAATITISAKTGGASQSVNVTASYPSLAITSAEDSKAYTSSLTSDGPGVATFHVSHADGLSDFVAPTEITPIDEGGTWTVGETTYAQSSGDPSQGTVQVNYTYNSGGYVGTRTAELTLSASSGATLTLTLSGVTEPEATDDAKVIAADGETLIYQGDWATALTKANANADCTLQLLRDVVLDLPNVQKKQQDFTNDVTLDLNGKTLSTTTLNATYYALIRVNKAGKTLTIKDSKTGGKIVASGARDNRLDAVEVTAGNLVLKSGYLEVKNTNTSTTTADRLYSCVVYVGIGQNFTMDGGELYSERAARDAYGVYGGVDASKKAQITINKGTITAKANTYAYGLRGYCDFYINGGTIHAETMTGAYAYGIYLRAGANATATSGYYGRLTMTDGTIEAVSKTSYAYGVFADRHRAGTGTTTSVDGTHSNQETGQITISGGTIKALPTTSYAYGVVAYGNFSSKDNKHITHTIQNTKIEATATTNAYGVYGCAEVNGTYGTCHAAEFELTNCEVAAETTTGATAYAVWASTSSSTVFKNAQPNYYGEYACGAKITINSGTYTATTKTTNAYAIGTSARAKTTYDSESNVTAERKLGGNAEGYATLNIHGGTFRANAGSTTARAVSNGGNCTIDGGEFEAHAGTNTADGIYTVSGKLKASGVQITVTAATKTAYGIRVDAANVPASTGAWTGFNYAGDAELNNLDVNVSTGTAEGAYGVYLNAVSYQYTQSAFDTYFTAQVEAGKVTQANYDIYSVVFPGNSSYAIAGKAVINGGKYTVRAATTTAHGIYSVNRAVSNDKAATAATEMTVKNVKLDVKTNGTTTACGIRTAGPSTIDGADIKVNSQTTTCYGMIISDQEETTVTNTKIDASGTATVYGIFVNATAPSTTNGYDWHGKAILGEGNDVTAAATAGATSYAVYLHANKATVASGEFAGNYANAAEATINGGKYTATATGGTAYAACVADPAVQGDVTATPTLIINDGKFKGTSGTTPYADVSLAGEPGYFVLNGGYYVKDENLDKKLGEGMNKVAVKSGTPEHTEGYRWRITDNMTGEAVCKIVQNSTSYASLEEALQVVNASPGSTWTIVMTANYTLSKGDYEIPAKTTLLIPYKSGQTTINGATPAWVDKRNTPTPTTPSPYMKLTFANGVNMTVKGKIEASSTTYINQNNWTGVPGGPYGWLQLNEGSHIDLESGAYLFAWGYVTGTGDINAKNGSYIYEDFQMGDWRGGTMGSSVNGNKNGLGSKGVFLLTDYYFQNVECPITYRPGAQSIAYSGCYMEKPNYGLYIQGKSDPVTMVGTSGAMFLMNPATAGENTWVRKEYDAEKDQLVWTLNSGASLGSFRLKISASFIDVDMNTSDYVLPMATNFKIVANEGDINITNDICFLPGSEAIVKKEANLVVPTGKRVFIYDADDWSSYGGYFHKIGYSPSWKACPRLMATSTKLADAKIEVAGTLDIQGSLYTTAGGGNIFSTRENAGKLKLGAAAPASTDAIADFTGNSGQNKTLCQLVGNGSEGHYVGKALTAAKLKNEDGSYTPTTGAASGDIYAYMEDPSDGVYRWLSVKDVGCFTEIKGADTKQYIHPSDFVAVEANANGDHAYHNEGSTRYFVNAEAASGNASCVWWEAEPKGIIDGVTYYMANNGNFDNYGTYFYWDNSVSYWKPKKITVTWKDKDGNKITNGTFGDEYNFNTSPQFFGTNPTWANSATEKHDWIGWRDEDGNIYDKNATLPAATADETVYTAYFETSKYQYTITFKNDDNSDLWAGLVDAGTTGAELQALFETKYNEKTGSTIPLKAPSVDKVYTFDSWNTTLATVTAAATYTASYTWTTRKYHVTFYNYDAATILYEADVDYNTRPVYAGVTPFRSNTSAYSYEWTGWQKGSDTYDTTDNLALVTGDVYYVATFSQTTLKYQVFFKRQDGTTIDAPFFEYEETPAAFPANPTLASTVSTNYTFDHWDPATLTPVTEDGKVYTAYFSESPRQYTAHFVNYNGTSLNADQTIDYNTVPAYTGATPFKPNDSRNSFEFSGWAWEAGADWDAGSIDAGEAFPAIKGNITFTAQFNPVLLQFNVIYQREGGTFIKQDKVKWGQNTEAPAAADCNYDDEQYTYTFHGWSPATIVNPVTIDAIYIAQYTTTPKSYSVTLNTNGGTINAGNVTSYTYGTGATLPTNVSLTGYDFDGWYDNSGLTGSAVTNISATATGNKTYWAKWTIKTFTVTWKNADGTILETDTDVPYGTTPTYDGVTPTKATDATYSYSFNGWSSAVGPISGNTTYTATYSTTPTVASVAASGTPTTYHATVADAITAANDKTDAVVTMLQNASVTSEVTITAAMTIDLNGKTISSAVTTAATGVFKINASDKTVTITDNGTGGKISHKANCTGYLYGINLFAGSLNVEGGHIYAENTYATAGTAYRACGIMYADNQTNPASLTMSGGTVEAKRAKTYVYGISIYTGNCGLTMTGGTVKVSGGDGLVRGIYTQGTAVLSNVTVTAEAAITGTNNCYTVFSDKNGNYTINSGTYTATSTSTGTNAYAISLTKASSAPTGGSAIVNGGRFSGKSKELNISNGTITLQGGYYVHNTELEEKCATNYHVLDLTGEDPYLYEVAEAYQLTWNLDGGTVVTAGTQAPVDATGTPSGYVAKGATLTAPVVEKTGYTFDGWNTSGGTAAATMPAENTTYTATWVASIADRELDIVDWTSNSITINVTNLKAVGGTNKNNWKIRVNGTDYTRTSPECSTQSRTLTISGLSLTPNENLLIQLKNDADVIESQHNYKIPQIYNAENATLSGTTEESVVYVYGGKLTISGNTTLAALYVCPGAEVEVTDGNTLTVGKLVLRTKPWATAAISGSVEATNTYYTRIAPDGSVAYPTGQYYQFGLPYACAVSAVSLSDGTTPVYNSTWLLKSYNEERRAKYGTSTNNWDALAADATIEAGRGYEMFSSYKYYREYYFHVIPTDNTSVAVTRHEDDKNNSGWNIVCSPLMNVYHNESDPVDGLKVSWLLADGSYDQEWPETIWPAMPFSYQASATGYLDFSTNEFNQTVSAPRRAAYKENIQTEWIHLDVKDGNGVGDHTSVFVHPDRFEATYQTGIDVAKQSFTASRALIYSSHAYGEMAFAGVSDSLLARGIAMTIYSPKAQELTFSMRENNWLNRLSSVWLIDNETGYRTDLLWSTYTFDAPEGTTAGRFTIAGEFYAPQIATGMEGTSARDNKARKVLIDQKMYILVNGQVFDATGKMVTE